MSLTPGSQEVSDAEPDAAQVPLRPEEIAPAPAPAPAPVRPGTAPTGAEVGEDPVKRAQEQLQALRQQQEAIERQKRELEALSQRQAAFESARADISRQLSRAVVALEREQYDAEKVVEHLRASREKLEHQVNLLSQIQPERWAKAELARELDRADSQVQDAQQVLSRSCVQINSEVGAEVLAPVRAQRAGGDGVGQWSFWTWLKAGLAFTLPLFALLAGAFALFFHFLFNILAGGQ